MLHIFAEEDHQVLPVVSDNVQKFIVAEAVQSGTYNLSRSICQHRYITQLHHAVEPSPAVGSSGTGAQVVGKLLVISVIRRLKILFYILINSKQYAHHASGTLGHV